MPDRLHVYYDDLVAAMATVGIDISPASGVRDVRMDPKGVTTVRMVRAEPGGGMRMLDGEPVLIENWYELRYARPACTCPTSWTNAANAGGGPLECVRTDDPACPQHGDQR